MLWALLGSLPGSLVWTTYVSLTNYLTQTQGHGLREFDSHPAHDLPLPHPCNLETHLSMAAPLPSGS